MKRLIIFLKAPRAGLVKTRLAQSIGPEAALAAYKKLVLILLKNLKPLHDVELRFAPDDAQKDIRPWIRKGWKSAPQGHGDLGVRLKKALKESFDAGCGKVVIIGSDCPEVTEEDIQAAWKALDDHELVLGPAADGGYWLIGMTKYYPLLLEGIPWSTESVFAETFLRAEKLGLRIALLRTLTDIDTFEDWERFRGGDQVVASK